MKRAVKKIVYVALCCLPLSGTAQTGQNINSPAYLYQEGKQLYMTDNFAAASVLFENYLKENPDGQDREEVEYMLIISAFRLRAYDNNALLEKFVRDNPDTPNKDMIYTCMAMNAIEKDYKAEQFAKVVATFEEANASVKRPNINFDLLGAKDRNYLLFMVANSYLETGDLPVAASLFTTLGELSKKYVEDCDYSVAYIRYAQQRYPEALSGFRPLLGSKKYGQIVPFYMADIYLDQKNYTEAETIAKNYLAAYPNNPNAGDMYRVLGMVNYNQRNYSAAISNFEKYIASTATPDRNALYDLGISYYITGVYSQAANTLAQVTQPADAMSQNAYLHMGIAYIELADRNKARMAFEQAAAMDFSKQIQEQAAYNYALCLHESAYSGFGESVTAFERFLNDYPNSVYAAKASSYLVEVYFNTRNYEVALQSIDRIKQPDTQILTAKQRILFQMGTQAFAGGEFGQAIQYFDQSIALGGYNPQTRADALYWRGESYYRLNNLAQATSNLKMYLQQTNDKKTRMYALANYTLGYIEFHQKNYTVARNYFLNYIQLAHQEDADVTADTYNRLADCYLKERDFNEAKHYYSLAEQGNSNAGAYAFYQMAFLSGLQKDYSGKITLLNRMLGKYPDSPYTAEALYEKGRAYVQMGNNGQAITSYDELLQKYPESPLSRKAAAEVGLLYYQSGNYDKAIAAYQEVIKKYPGSEEARLAMADLKSIYVDMNRVDEYAKLAESMPGHIRIDVSEQDSLSYIAAEKIYMRGRIEEAKSSFNRYLEGYPEGAFMLNAHYYLCLIGKEQKNPEQILIHSGKLLNYPDNPYSEEALWMRAEVQYNNRDYAGALQSYTMLKDKSATAERRLLAKTGMLRSAHLLKSDNETIEAATLLLQEPKLTPELSNEAYYYRSKAYQNKGMSKEAMGDWRTLAKDTRNVYGAEARYLVANQLYQWGHYDSAEQELLDYIDQSTPHIYWLARSFVLLSDVYVAKGQNEDARQYLLSLQQNYPANDDIPVMIRGRLEKLNQ